MNVIIKILVLGTTLPVSHSAASSEQNALSLSKKAPVLKKLSKECPKNYTLASAKVTRWRSVDIEYFCVYNSYKFHPGRLHSDYLWKINRNEDNKKWEIIKLEENPREINALHTVNIAGRAASIAKISKMCPGNHTFSQRSNLLQKFFNKPEDAIFY